MARVTLGVLRRKSSRAQLNDTIAKVPQRRNAQAGSTRVANKKRQIMRYIDESLADGETIIQRGKWPGIFWFGAWAALILLGDRSRSGR
jgi:hypothetical protein